MVTRKLLAPLLTSCITSIACEAAGGPGSPQIGNFSQSLTWGEIDRNIPPVLGNGDIGGLFDPFGGTTYDELRFGSGHKRDIRTLLLTRVMVPDYWVLEDQSAHFLDPRHYRPSTPRRYLTLGCSYEHDDGHSQKVASQLIGVVMTPLFDERREAFGRTFDRLRKTIDIETCAWSPGYYAIAAARLKRPKEALRALEEAFRFSEPPWVYFVENTRQVPGRMPCYLAAHALFVQGINELLLQDWSDRVELFPACPFDEAAFRLRGKDRIIEARLHQGNVELLSDAPEN